jgi:excinuclease ABC subunit C
MEKSKLDLKLADCPPSPGVYLMKNSEAKVIYVGKAKNLKKRVSSYFQAQRDLDPKTALLVSKIEDLEWVPTGTEAEAFLLENTFIKKWKPRYNIRLRDDKSYPYIRIDIGHEYPRPYVARRPQKRDDQILFGPYVQASAVHQAIDMASKVFLLRDCRDGDFANRSRPCLSYQIGQCTAPCVQLVSKEKYAEQLQDFVRFLKGDEEALGVEWQKKMESASEAMNFEEAARYRDRLRALETLREPYQRVENVGDHSSLDVWAAWPESISNDVSDLDLVVLHFREGKLVGRDHFPIPLEEKFLDEESPLMGIVFQYYAKKELPSKILLPPSENLPDAQQLASSLLQALKSESQVEIHKADEKKDWAQLWELGRENAKVLSQEEERRRTRSRDALLGLQHVLELENMPVRIDCVDVSNFQGTANVASCVVFENGRPHKESYRHYKIKTVQGQNDFASMKEVMVRRYGKGRENWPDLLIIDGGKGQLSSVMIIMKELGCNFPVVGLAKARTKRNFRSEDVESSEERFFIPGQSNPKKIKNRAALSLVTRIRDEAHRFAITFHRKIRDDKSFE